jgi:methyl-accepting chemotaxis protein
MAGRETYQTDLHQLEQMSTQNAAQVSRWQNIDRLAGEWQQEVTEPTIARRRTLGIRPGAADEMAASLTDEVGNDRIQAVRSIFADALSVEQATLEARQQEQAASDARLRVVLIWGTVGAAALAAILGSWVFRTLERERLAGVRLAIQTAEHELYNRLAAASGNVQLLERDSDLNSRQQAWAARARSSIDAAVGVIRHMRDLPVLGETVWSEARVITIDFAR